MRSAEERIKEALDGLQIVQVLSADRSDNQISALCRIRDARAWLPIIDAVLEEEERLGEDPPWNVHICKLYMRSDGRLVYVWNIVVQANGDVDRAADDICRLLILMGRNLSRTVMSAPRAEPKRERRPNMLPGEGEAGTLNRAGEVESMPLVGQTENRNALKRGRGARYVRAE